MSDCLSHILSPVDTGTFLKHYQAREYLHVRRDIPDYYANILSAGDLDEFLQCPHLDAALVNVVHEGRGYTPEDWSRVDDAARGERRVLVPERLFDLYSQGATLILNQVHRAIPSIRHLCGELTADLGFPVAANVYITPRGVTGFSKHADTHEVLVMQIAGSKRWLLYPRNAPVLEIDLYPGDLLYLPRGLAHAATALDRDSIHVTLGLTPVYAYQLIAELAALAVEDGDFQQPLPPVFAGDDARRAFESAFLDRLRILLLNNKPSELLARRFNSLMEKEARGLPGRLSDLRAWPDMTTRTMVCRRSGLVTHVKEEGKFLKVGFAGKHVVIPAFLQGALLTILSGNRFAIQDLEGFISSPGKVKLVAEFVRAGLLRILEI